jgi:DNA-binding NtrC family response regulator
MPGEGKSILIIDDDPGIRLGYREALRSAGFEVEGAEDGQEGLKATMRRDFDLILLDIFMPNMNGLDCIRALKISRPEVPVIIITANEESEIAKQAFKCGARDLIPKPIPNDVLVQTVREALALPVSD